jgi:hypothetical protein
MGGRPPRSPPSAGKRHVAAAGTAVSARSGRPRAGLAVRRGHSPGRAGKRHVAAAGTAASARSGRRRAGLAVAAVTPPAALESAMSPPQELPPVRDLAAAEPASQSPRSLPRPRWKAPCRRRRSRRHCAIWPPQSRPRRPPRSLPRPRWVPVKIRRTKSARRFRLRVSLGAGTQAADRAVAPRARRCRARRCAATSGCLIEERC